MAELRNKEKKLLNELLNKLPSLKKLDRTHRRRRRQKTSNPQDLYKHRAFSLLSHTQVREGLSPGTTTMLLDGRTEKMDLIFDLQQSRVHTLLSYTLVLKTPRHSHRPFLFITTSTLTQRPLLTYLCQQPLPPARASCTGVIRTATQPVTGPSLGDRFVGAF